MSKKGKQGPKKQPDDVTHLMPQPAIDGTNPYSRFPLCGLPEHSMRAVLGAGYPWFASTDHWPKVTCTNCKTEFDRHNESLELYGVRNFVRWKVGAVWTSRAELGKRQ